MCRHSKIFRRKMSTTLPTDEGGDPECRRVQRASQAGVTSPVGVSVNSHLRSSVAALAALRARELAFPEEMSVALELTDPVLPLR